MTLAQKISKTLDVVITDRLERLEVALPARIEKYWPEEQRAHVKPLVKYVVVDQDGWPYPAMSQPVIPSVPVVFFAAGGYSLTGPVNVGDFCLLVFASESLVEWLYSAEGGDTDPKDHRRHDVNDAIALMGLRPYSKALPSARLPHLSIGKEGGLRIHVKENEVCLGEENPSELVAIASRVEAAINSLKSAFDTHVHSVQTAPGLSGVPVPMPPLEPGDPPLPEPITESASGLGSTTVKVKP